jgi:hypothetical protein
MRATAGIVDTARLGFSVKENADRLRLFAYLEQRLMFLAARHMHRIPE